jgi:ribosome-associated translation inhibitor RaiA
VLRQGAEKPQNIPMHISIRAKDLDLTERFRHRVERRVRLALARVAGNLAGVTVRIEARDSLAEGDARGRYVCRIAMTPARLEIEEEHDRLDTAIDRAVDRAARLATPLGIRSPPASRDTT